MALTHSPSIVTNGLVLCLDAANRKSYPSPFTGTAWTDLSGRGNTGTLENGVGYNSSNGGSLTFDRSNDYISLPTNSINSNADLTLNFWVNHSPLSSPFTEVYTLLSGFSTNSHLQVRYITTGTGSGLITSLQLNKSGVADMGTFSGFTSLNNTINLITVILIKSTNTWYLYTNGTFRSSFVSSQTFTTSSPALGTSLNGEFFKGNMYSFSYYNRALTAGEIQQNFNATRSRFGV